jgi:hypothetical protein
MLMSACQQYEKNDDEFELEELFHNFLVRTAKAQHQRMPADFSKLGPLRSHNFSSCTKLAENIINHKTNNVSTEIEEDYDNVQTETYINICKGIVAFKKCLRGQSLSFLKKFVGYKVMQHRAHPYSVKKPGRITDEMNQVIRLIDLANNVARNKPKCRTPTCIVINVEQEQQTNNITNVSSPKRKKEEKAG